MRGDALTPPLVSYVLVLAFALGSVAWLGWQWLTCDGVLVHTLAGWQHGRASMKPTIPEVAPLVVALYARDPAGCCWHVVLDDRNVGPRVVADVAESARAHPCGHADCSRLTELLPQMSPTQVGKLARIAARQGACQRGALQGAPEGVCVNTHRG